MTMKINKKAYTELIQEDLDWLNKNSPDSLEKIHIEAVLHRSIDLLYPKQLKDIKYKKACPDCGSTSVIVFDADNDLCKRCGAYFPGT